MVAWLYQLIKVLQGDSILQKIFIGGYGLGVLFLAIDGYRTGSLMIASLNLIVLILAFFVMILVKAKK